MRIQHNIGAMRALQSVNKKSSRLEKLASGYRINRAADDAGGLAISEKMRAQIRGLQTAQGNTQDAVSLLQTADGALSEVHVMLHRMRELAVQASNGTYTLDERQAMQQEIESLKSDIDRISESTNYNHIPLLDGKFSSGAAGAAQGKAVYEADIDLTNVTDAASIEIDGEVFEFDTDGIQSIAGSSMVDISAAANAADKAQAFQNAVMVSNLGSRFEIAFENTAGGALHMKLTALYGGGEAIPVTFQPIPQTGDPFEVEVVDPNPPPDYIAIYAADGVDINKIVDGTTIKINDTVFEFDIGDGVNNAGAVSVDLSDRSRINFAFEDAFNSTPMSADYMLNMSATTPGGNIYRIEAFGFNPAAPITNIELNPPSTWPYQFQGDNVSNSSVGGDSAPDQPGITFQIGSSGKETMQVFIEGSSSRDLGVRGISLQSVSSSNAAIASIDRAVDMVSRNRSSLGAAQNRLEHTMNNLGIGAENLAAAESRIRDADMARELVGHAKDNILAQAAQAMLAQANHLPEGVLQLLK